MVIGTDDTGLDSLISQVKELFQGQQSLVQPSAVAPKSPTENIPIGAGSLQAPLKGTWHSSGGFDPISIRPNGRKGHMGLDMRAPAGTPIYPLAPGVVTSVGTDPLGGNVVNVKHDNGIRSYYAHLSTAKVFKGDKVDNNTIIGSVGNTGNASHTFPHLHFQVWKDEQLQDPAHFFNVPPYTNLSVDEKKQGEWLSEQARQEAAQFNMKEHVSQSKRAFTRKLSQLVKLANQFYKLSSE